MAGSSQVPLLPSHRTLHLVLLLLLTTASLTSALPAKHNGVLDKIVYVGEDPAIDKWRSELSGAGIYPAHYALKALDLLPQSGKPVRYVRRAEPIHQRSNVILDDSLGVHKAVLRTPTRRGVLDTRRRHGKGKNQGGHDDNGYDDGSWRGDHGNYGSSRKGSHKDDDDARDDRSGKKDRDDEEQEEEEGYGRDSRYGDEEDDGTTESPENEESPSSDAAEDSDSTFAPGKEKSKFKSYGNTSSDKNEDDESSSSWLPPGSSQSNKDAGIANSKRPGDGEDDNDSNMRGDEDLYDDDDPSAPSLRASSTDCNALKTFFDDMGGPEWVQSRGWSTLDSSSSKSCCQAYGVSCNTLGRVTALDLGSNGLSGPLSPAVFELRYLSRLNLSTNAISAQMPDKFDTLPHLSTVYLDQNRFTGTLPPTLQQSSSISALHISNNTLEGSLAFPNTRNLTRLYASRNRFTGIDIAANSALIKIALDDNQFNCTLPNIETFTDLQVFSVARNHFAGSPPVVTDLKQLVRLDLQANNLSGTFPDVTGLPRLQYLGLNGNSDLTGPFPTGQAPTTLITCHIDTVLASGCPAQSVLDDPSSLAAKCSLNCRGGGKPANAAPEPGTAEDNVASSPPSNGNEKLSKQRLASSDETGQTPASLAKSLSSAGTLRLQLLSSSTLVLVASFTSSLAL